MVGRRDEAPLVPLYRFRSPNKAMALPELLAELAQPSQAGGRLCGAN